MKYILTYTSHIFVNPFLNFFNVNKAVLYLYILPHTNSKKSHCKKFLARLWIIRAGYTSCLDYVETRYQISTRLPNRGPNWRYSSYIIHATLQILMVDFYAKGCRIPISSLIFTCEVNEASKPKTLKHSLKATNSTSTSFMSSNCFHGPIVASFTSIWITTPVILRFHSAL